MGQASKITLAKWCSKFSKPGFNSTWTMNFQIFKLDLEKAEEPEIKLPISMICWIIEKANSVQFSRSVMSDSLRPHELQHSRPSCPSPTPRVYPNPCPLSRWCHPTIYPLSSPSPLALNISQHQGLFQWVSSLHQVAKVLELQLQRQSFQWRTKKQESSRKTSISAYWLHQSLWLCGSQQTV